MAFNSICNRVTSVLRKAERSYSQTLHRDFTITGSPVSARQFWDHFKRLSGKKKRTLIPDLVDQCHIHHSDSSQVVSSDTDKANLLNRFFVQQTVLPDSNLPVPDVPVCNTESFTTLYSCPLDVYDVLRSLKPRKAPGADDIPPLLLKECARGISPSLSALFNLSFTTGKVPVEWKQGLVIPVLRVVTAPHPLTTDQYLSSALLVRSKSAWCSTNCIDS